MHKSPLLHSEPVTGILKHLYGQTAFCALLASVLMLLSVTIGFTFTSASGKVPCTRLVSSARVRGSEHWRLAHRPYFFCRKSAQQT
jgi:hypothetical protein